MAESYVYASLEIGGIQKYIAGTGKLREMIGASEIIHYLIGEAPPGEESFLDLVMKQLGLEQSGDYTPGPGRYVLVQNNAGALRLILPDAARAKEFLAAFSQKAFEEFPGLPLFGASCPMAMTRESYNKARTGTAKMINEQRARCPVFHGMPMLPILYAARLDGLPAAESGPDQRRRDYLSLPSAARCQRWVLDQARARLRGYMNKALAGKDLDVKIEWKDDLEEMLAGSGGDIRKVALICMDGNDLGKLFGEYLKQEGEAGALETGIKRMMKLSKLVDASTTEAFANAAAALLPLLRKPGDGGPLIMPMRPLIIGGDDISVIIRADLAMDFIKLYTDEFERISARKFQQDFPGDKGGRLTLGIGMVVMSPSWPFTRAFALAEELQDSAKKATQAMRRNERPSSLDYLVLTEEVEPDIEALRRRLFTAPGELSLTGKPFQIRPGALEKFIANGRDTLERLPRSLLRGALTACRKGMGEANKNYLNIIDNLKRGLGGRKGETPLSAEEFRKIFARGFTAAEDEILSGFFSPRDEKPIVLGDYLELERLLPDNAAEGEETLERAMGGTSDV